MENMKNVEMKRECFESVKTLYNTLAKCSKEQEEYSYVPVSYTRERLLTSSLWDDKKK